MSDDLRERHAVGAGNWCRRDGMSWPCETEVMALRFEALTLRADALAEALRDNAVDDDPHCWCEYGPVSGDDGDDHVGTCRDATAALKAYKEATS